MGLGTVVALLFVCTFLGYFMGKFSSNCVWNTQDIKRKQEIWEDEQEFFVSVRTAISSDSAEQILANLGRKLRELASENIQLEVDTGLASANVIQMDATDTLARRADEIKRTYEALVDMHTWFTKVGENIEESVDAYMVLPPSPPTP